MATTKIKLTWPGLDLEFGTTSELRDALLASWPAASFFNGPLVGENRGYDIDTYPSWGWVANLIRRRADWWPAIGVALQHAVRDGGELAQRALADLHANYTESIVLLEWTEPLAKEFPDARATRVRVDNAVYQGPEYRLEAIVAKQRALRDDPPPIAIKVFDEAGDYAPPVQVTVAADFGPALVRTAKGAEVLAEEGPWGWIGRAALYHPWLLPLIPETTIKLAHGTDHEVRALLDFLLMDAMSLYQCVDLLEGLKASSPRWWNDPSTAGTPKGWWYPPRFDTYYKTLGDVAEAVLGLAKWHVDSKPVLTRSSGPAAIEKPGA